MFFSIPVNSEQVITNTPVGVKSITHVYFENKNSGIFNYKRDADNVTITVDGKMICRNVPILPFTSSCTYGVNRHKWEDIALEVGLNVNMSEIKISAQNCNDFNVVFVCSDKMLDSSRGFDFVEAKRIKIIDVLGKVDKQKLTESIIAQAKAKGSATISYVSLSGNSRSTKITYPFELLSSKGSPNRSDIEGKEVLYRICGNEITRLGDDDGYRLKYIPSPANIYIQILTLDHGLHPELDADISEQHIAYIINNTDMVAVLNPSNLGIEHTISLDRAPEKMFAYQVISNTTQMDNPTVLKTGDIAMKFTLSGADNEEFPANTDLSVISATDNTAWRESVHEFGQIMPKTLQVALDIKGDDFDSNTIDKYSKLGYPSTWDVYLFFIYKKTI